MKHNYHTADEKKLFDVVKRAYERHEIELEDVTVFACEPGPYEPMYTVYINTEHPYIHKGFIDIVNECIAEYNSTGFEVRKYDYFYDFIRIFMEKTTD